MHRSRLVLLGVAAVLVMGACAQVTGGGYIASRSGSPGKANFGFNLTCDPSTQKISGQFQYVDKANNVSFHAKPDTMVVNLFGTWIPYQGCTADPINPEFIFFGGFYSLNGQSGSPAGRYIISFSDQGEPGPSSGDSFCLFLDGGPYSGYENCKPLSGGNIQMHKF